MVLLSLYWTSLVVHMVKHLPTMRETWVQSLDREDPLEKEMATHSSILAWRIPWTEELGTLQSMGLQSRTQLSNFTSLSLCHVLGPAPFPPVLLPYLVLQKIPLDLFSKCFQTPPIPHNLYLYSLV